MNQLKAIDERERGKQWSNNEVFEGIVKAILSSNVDWAKIENVINDLHIVFHDYDIDIYSTLTDDEIEKDVLSWFVERKANSTTLKQNLKLMRNCAAAILKIKKNYSDLESFLIDLFHKNNKDTKTMALCLGHSSSINKLPGIGIALAAEALKNLGFDVAKPDRHINRAIASLGLIKINTWYVDQGGKKVRATPKTGYAYPSNTKNNCIKIMEKVEEIADYIEKKVTFIDNAIWLLCAKSGLHYSNESITELTYYSTQHVNSADPKSRAAD